MIEKLRIKNFCCCCTIRTGSLVIGVIGWMGSLLQAMTLSSSAEKETITDTDTGVVIEAESGPNIGTILICIFMFGVSLSLVFGVYQDNRKYILPWLVIKFLECCVLTLITIVTFGLLFVSETVGEIFVIFFISGILGALFWYCWICVWSLYMDLGEITETIVPMGQTIPMTETMQYPQYPTDVKPVSPPQEMV